VVATTTRGRGRAAVGIVKRREAVIEECTCGLVVAPRRGVVGVGGFRHKGGGDAGANDDAGMEKTRDSVGNIGIVAHEGRAKRGTEVHESGRVGIVGSPSGGVGVRCEGGHAHAASSKGTGQRQLGNS
jgi:hypothetical protein